MKKILAKIFSYSPILAITDDNNFGTNELKGTQASYRFSLLNIFLGHIAIYFITYNLCYKNFSLFHKIVMEECGDLYYKCNVETINKKTQKYVEEHLNTLSNEDIAIEKNFIIYLNSNECERIELSERKINLYTTIVLAIIPLMLTFFDLKTFFLYAIHEKILG
ncbi:MAG TPA: hypothetical protein DCW91_02310 [Acinetobacter nosocomialis]|nr:hypothetical protein [Acinetobacter nosocomialis]